MNIKYSKDHEWVDIQEKDIVTIGITNFAQEQLGDLVYIELPKIGDKVSQGDNICVIESVKAASDLIAPLSGEVVEVNKRLQAEPELVNNDATKDGWFIKMKLADVSELDKLMDYDTYQSFSKE